MFTYELIKYSIERANVWCQMGFLCPAIECILVEEMGRDTMNLIASYHKVHSL